MKPFVGLPTEGEWCAFSPDLDVSACGQPPALHLLVYTGGTWGEVELSTCLAHASIARAAGQLVAEHPYGPDCPEGTACWGAS